VLIIGQREEVEGLVSLGPLSYMDQPAVSWTELRYEVKLEDLKTGYDSNLECSRSWVQQRRQDHQEPE
jgi:hypothetical protein